MPSSLSLFLYPSPLSTSQLPNLPTPNLRPRTGICSLATTIRIDRNSRITLSRIPWNRRQEISTGVRSPTPRNLDLRAFCVELGGARLVQSDEFVAHEIVARCERGWDAGFPVQVLEDEGGAPVCA